jgi:hypothetical protein
MPAMPKSSRRAGPPRLYETPNSFNLTCYPNPFRDAATFTYSLPSASLVTLKLYTLLGKEMRTIVDGVQDAGAHHAWFAPGPSLPSGLYLCRLTADGRQAAGVVCFGK